MAAPTTASTDSGIDIPPSASTEKGLAIPQDEKEVALPSTEKELAIPNNNTDEQVFSHPTDSDKIVDKRATYADMDTSKQAIPRLRPVSMEKEVLPPSGLDDGDKQLTSTLTTSSLSHTDTVTPSLSRSNAYQTFRVQKFSPYGLILPENQKLALHAIHPTTHANLGVAYVTGEMSWMDVMSVLPPMFELFRSDGMATLSLVGRSLPKGWEGVSGVEVEIEADVEGGREKWEISRRGLSRTYKLRRGGERGVRGVWKGTSSSVKELIGSSEGMDGGTKEKVHKGNLKLVAEEGGEVLAVWQQARDPEVLGDLIIFNEARGKVATEVIVLTCLTAVSAERASGMNWFGGWGK